MTKEEIALAKELDLLTYFKLVEPGNLKLVGKEYRHKVHSSLTISKDSLWCWHCIGLRGRTALKYLIDVEKVPYVEAVREINRIQGGVVHSSQPVSLPQPRAEPEAPRDFKLPKPDANSYAAMAYLRGRCIHPNVLAFCRKEGILYQTSFKNHPNCVFVGRDGESVAKGGSLRGCTQLQFRRDIPGSKKIYPFYIQSSTKADTVEVYEAPIDAKTTITKLINGLIPHFVEGGTLSGTTIVNGMNAAQTEMYRLAEQVGSVFQNPKSQFFNIDSDSEITFGLENAGVEPRKIKERYDATVSALKIQSLLGRNIFSMSGGEKQSLAFASVYAMNPSIFVLDEPTANLDAGAIDTLRQQIIQIKKEGRTVVIAEHRLYFLMDLIDRAIFIQKGKIVQIFSGNEFRNLSDEQRIRMGLRSLVHPVLELPPADPSGAQEGLSVENLFCAFDKQPVFSGLGFSAKRGEVLGIVGHNGAGKTTMTRCLCGLLKEVDGTVRLDGQTLKAKQRNKASFCVMQDVNHQLFSDSVWNECELAQPDCPSERIEEILRSFDLLDFKDRHPMALSGGQKQRLAVATAILSDKDVLVFDEPTSGLDYHRMLEVSDMIRKLNDENKVIIIVSHDFEFLGRTCDKIFDMEGCSKERR